MIKRKDIKYNKRWEKKIKPSELLKADTVSNPIAQSYIDNKIKSKTDGKITNKLIRNEQMTKDEAMKAKKQLKNNSLPPALSTRSNDRVLRKRWKIQFLKKNKIIFYQVNGIILLYILVKNVPLMLFDYMNML